MRTRRGFTLVELLIALVLLGLVTASLFSLLNTTQRVTRAQAERTSLQSNVRTGAIVVPSELRQINTVVGGLVAQNDILGALTANSITYRAMRGMGSLCQASTSTEIRVYNAAAVAPFIPWIGYRNPVAIRDSVYVFLDKNEHKDSDDEWKPARITAVATGNVCPGGVPGFTLTINPAVPELDVASIIRPGIGTPVRTYEVMTLALYQSGGEWWLGGQSVSAGENMQPMLGPLSAGDGFALAYFNSAGGTTVDSKQVKSIQVTLRGLSDQKVVSGTGTGLKTVGDTLRTQVVLRNSLR